MFTSTDLTHWRYAGDAFPTKPAWVTGDIWAPDVVFHDGRYLMYFTASDTEINGGGSAIGVATSASPTGPWTAMSTPVVAPSVFQDGTRWNFDPEVVYVGAKAYLYFGSYFGGISVRELGPDGLTSDPATETPIAIDNRYEGTFIVRRNGWFYFMGSATNCCNGPLTGYAVFVARSRSPLGPFLDEHGRSILAARVGGTPLLTQNGNRWVGTGHNAVVTDYSGQQWIVYHAVDRNDPYYANNVGYTKRPALIDPLDWRDGWPVVRGGPGRRTRGSPARRRSPASGPRTGRSSCQRAPRPCDQGPVGRLPRFGAVRAMDVGPPADVGYLRGCARRVVLADAARRPASAGHPAGVGADRARAVRRLRRRGQGVGVGACVRVLSELRPGRGDDLRR